MKRDLVYTHKFVLSFNPGNTDLPLLLDRIERLDLHLQVHQLLLLKIPQKQMRFLQLYFQRFQLLQGVVPLLVPYRRPVRLLLPGEPEQQQVLRQNVNRRLPPLHQADDEHYPKNFDT